MCDIDIIIYFEAFPRMSLRSSEQNLLTPYQLHKDLICHESVDAIHHGYDRDNICSCHPIKTADGQIGAVPNAVPCPRSGPGQHHGRDNPSIDGGVLERRHRK